MNLFVWNTATSLAVVLSFVIPLLSSLLSKIRWPSEVTGILSLAIAFANGLFTEAASSSGPFEWKNAIGITLFSYLVAVAARYGLWKDTATDAKLLAVGSGPAK